ncbi:MAG TPA: serine/threonine-protein kinase [Pyrinomonadaceae bacterium]|nr:serine/threonine-protein kinase [Pyrinomonadaceae bacterium]
MTPDENPNETAAQPEVAPTTLDPTTVDTVQRTPKELVGQLLNGRYAIQSELKRGGMGVVYLARDQQLHSRYVVVKVLLDEAYQSQYVVQKFRQEVEALSRIDHPGIVGIIDSGELPNGRPFIVMQYVEGVTLRSVMTSEGMNLDRVAEVTKQVGRALASAHGRGIFHRDLKPDNIMLQDLGHDEEQVKIIDFGIAKVKSSVVAPSTSLNLSPGTVAYMAPEQLSGRPITAATDIFALGAIVYEMVTGRKPFNPETGFELLQMQQTGVRVKPADLRPSLPVEAQAIILKALSFNPTDRQSTPRDFGDNLARALTEATATSTQVRQAPALPPTQFVSEETPMGRGVSSQPARTIQVPLQPASVPDAFAKQSGFGVPRINPPAAAAIADRSTASGGSKSKVALLLGVAALLLLIVGSVGAWLLFRPRKTSEPTPAAARNLNYGLTVQKMRDGKPYQDAFESSGQEIFENGWKFRMNIDSPQTGYLYLLNEGPSADNTTTYNVLFPAPSTNSGSPYLAANQKVETGWMVFDENQGTEKFWLVWAAEAVPELEAVKGVVNPQDKGEISDAGQRKAVKQFLEKHAAAELVAQKDKTKKLSNVKANGEVLVHRLELEHH